MLYQFIAKKYFDGIGSWFHDHLIQTNEKGCILKIRPAQNEDYNHSRILDGWVIPGMVNTHCHLELSHMKGHIDTGTTLLPFIKSIVQDRAFPREVILDAIAAADTQMYDNGIVAVGDISNTLDTLDVKKVSKIRYYSFVEMFDFMQPHLLQSTIEKYKSVYDLQSRDGHNKVSLVPHAPYSVSPQLFEFINNNNTVNATISIHNQETDAESKMFLYGTGDFYDFYKNFGLSLTDFKPLGKSSINYTLKHLSQKFTTIHVHNTMTSESDIIAAQNINPATFWATCPNANLYIENQLPKYKNFINTSAKVTIGTDSLASNWKLCIWSEIISIKKFQSYIPIESLITWATKNGAEALGYSDLGTIEIGKSPGLVQIIDPLENFKINRII